MVHLARPRAAYLNANQPGRDRFRAQGNSVPIKSTRFSGIVIGIARTMSRGALRMSHSRCSAEHDLEYLGLGAAMTIWQGWAMVDKLSAYLMLG